MNDYYQKYLKYKTKYLELKNKTNKMHNLIGGSKKSLIIHISSH